MDDIEPESQIFIFEDAVAFIERTIKDNVNDDINFKKLGTLLGRLNVYTLTNSGYYQQFWEKHLLTDQPLLEFILAESVHLNMNVLSLPRRMLLIEHLGDAISVHNVKGSEHSTLPSEALDRLPESESSVALLTGNFWIVYIVLFYYALRKK